MSDRKMYKVSSVVNNDLLKWLRYKYLLDKTTWSKLSIKVDRPPVCFIRMIALESTNSALFNEAC